MLNMWIEDLTLPYKPRLCMGKSGYSSVKEMQDELIRRRPSIWITHDSRYHCFEVVDRIEHGVDIWRFYHAAGCWRLIQRVTLEV